MESGKDMRRRALGTAHEGSVAGARGGGSVMKKTALCLLLCSAALLLLSFRFYAEAQAFPYYAKSLTLTGLSQTGSTHDVMAYLSILPLYDSYRFDLALGYCLPIVAGIVAAWGMLLFAPSKVRIVSGTVLFAFAILMLRCCLSIVGGWAGLLPSYPALNSLPAELFPLGKAGADNDYFALTGFVSLLMALPSCAAALNLLGARLWKSVVGAVGSTVVPAILALEAGVLVNLPSQMSYHVTNFALWRYDGVWLLSNWNVLYGGAALGALCYGSLLYSPLRRRFL